MLQCPLAKDNLLVHDLAFQLIEGFPSRKHAKAKNNATELVQASEDIKFVNEFVNSSMGKS